MTDIPPSPSTSRPYALAKAAAAVGSTTLLSRVLGLVRDTIIAGTFGAGGVTDAFFVAFRIPNMLRRFVAEGSLANAFVPVLTEESARSKEEAREAISAVASAVTLGTLVLSVALFLFAEPIIQTLSPGFAAGASDRLELAVTLLKVMAPFVLFISLTALTASALNVLGRFAVASLPSTVLNLTFIVFLLLFTHSFSPPVLSLAWAVVVGGALSLVLLAAQLASFGLLWRWRSPLRSQPVRKLLRVFLPSLYGSSLHQVTAIVTTLLASTLAEGSISWLYYAERVFQFPLGVFSVALGTAALPRLAELAQQGQEELSAAVERLLVWVLFLTVPASVGLFALAEPIIGAIYERGNFNGTAQTALALQAFVLGLCPLSILGLVSRVFFATKCVRIPAQVATFGIALHLLLALLLVGPAAVAPDTAFGQGVSWLQSALAFVPLGHLGLALASSLSALFSAVLALALLRRGGVALRFKPLFSSMLQIGAASGVMVLTLSLLKLGRSLWPIPDVGFVPLAVTAGAGTFFLTALLLQHSAAWEALSAGRGALKRLQR